MTFSVLIYAMGGYAGVVLSGGLLLEKVREPVRQAPVRHAGTHAQLRPWRRAARRCPVANETVLPLRSARLGAPARRRRPAPTSCRR
jgi:hypothetical protein